MLADVNLLHTNSVQYNGEGHSITAIAGKIVQTCKEQFDEHAEQLEALERILEQQMPLTGRIGEQTPTDDIWPQIMSTDPMSNFEFHPLLQGELWR